jgi:hypothetical protein
MAQILYDRVKETSTTTGTGAFTLAGAVSQFRSFSSVFASGAVGVYDPLYYCIAGQTGTEWEVGKGYLSSATVLVRDTVFSSSNAGALVNFSAGTKDVFNTITADRMEELWTKGESFQLAIGNTML